MPVFLVLVLLPEARWTFKTITVYLWKVAYLIHSHLRNVVLGIVTLLSENSESLLMVKNALHPTVQRPQRATKQLHCHWYGAVAAAMPNCIC